MAIPKTLADWVLDGGKDCPHDTGPEDAQAVNCPTCLQDVIAELQYEAVLRYSKCDSHLCANDTLQAGPETVCPLCMAVGGFNSPREKQAKSGARKVTIARLREWAGLNTRNRKVLNAAAVMLEALAEAEGD
jgi:hypothetical protein